jgi:E3 ubiquitin-protein ligase TRIP12
MFRAEVIGPSKVVSDHIQAKNRKKHRREVKNAKSLVDNSIPGVINVLKKNPKKQQMIEERYTEIERSNRILLEKMSNIIVGKNLDSFININATKRSSY